MLECVIEADRTPKKIKKQILENIIFDLAVGKIRFNDEAIPLVHLIGDHVLFYIDKLLAVKGNIQNSFYIAINDMLCNRNDKESRTNIRKIYNLFVKLEMTIDQSSSICYSYLTGINTLCYDLLKAYYEKCESLDITEYILQRQPDKLNNRKKEDFISALNADIKINIEINRILSHHMTKKKPVEFIHLNKLCETLVSSNPSYVGLLFGIRFFDNYHCSMFIWKKIIALCDRIIDDKLRVVLYKIIRSNVQRTLSKLNKLQTKKTQEKNAEKSESTQSNNQDKRKSYRINNLVANEIELFSSKYSIEIETVKKVIYEYEKFLSQLTDSIRELKKKHKRFTPGRPRRSHYSQRKVRKSGQSRI